MIACAVHATNVTWCAPVLRRNPAAVWTGLPLSVTAAPERKNCDTRSNQKGGIENVHTMLRMILPKGTVFEALTQWDIKKAVNHVNSAPRENLGGETPYKLSLKKYGPDILEALQLKFIPPDEVILSPKLLKK